MILASCAGGVESDVLSACAAAGTAASSVFSWSAGIPRLRTNTRTAAAPPSEPGHQRAQLRCVVARLGEHQVPEPGHLVLVRGAGSGEGQVPQLLLALSDEGDFREELLA